MKYLLACLLIPVVQLLFVVAFTAFALCIGLAMLRDRLAPAKIRK